MAVVLTGVLAGGGVAGTVPGAAPEQPVVGQVTSLAGSKRLYVKDEQSGGLRALHAGDLLHLGDRVAAGAGVEATLVLARPRGVSADAELVFVLLVATGTLLERGSRTEVTISH